MLSSAFHPEVPIPVTDQKDRGLWERDWLALVQSRTQILQAFWSAGERREDSGVSGDINLGLFLKTLYHCRAQLARL